MLVLPLVYAPDPVFRKKAEKVIAVDDGIREIVQAMFDTLYREKGLGMGANMVGVLKQIIVIDLQKDGIKLPLTLINPTITERSEELQTFNEASLSFPGISADITRPEKIALSYLDDEGLFQNMSAKGFLATVIQHEMDYLMGKTYLDHLSKLKRDGLIRKYRKSRK
jgi:peptide deformylase